MMPQLNCVSEIDDRLNKLISNFKSYEDSILRLSERSDNIDEIILGHIPLKKNQQSKSKSSHFFTGDNHYGGDGNDSSSSGSGLVHIMSLYPKLKNDMILIKNELKKICKYVGHTEKQCKESNVIINFLDERLGTMGDVLSTLNLRFTSHKEER